MASFCTQRPVHGDMFHQPMKRHRTEHRLGPMKRQRTHEIRVPPGWLDCPNLGERISSIIPSKVPLDESFDREIPVDKRYSFEQLKHLVPRTLGLVIDLTNTNRYYSVRELKNTFGGIDYVNIPCRGHGSVPDNDSVNRFVYEVSLFRKNSKEGILVHCTHGFNRTGYMIVHYLMRTMGESLSVTDAIKIFAGARPPGIYKPEYIDALYAFYHAEEKPGVIVYPELPKWKDSVHKVYPIGNPLPGNVYAELVKSDGDAIPCKQQEELRQLCNQLLGLGHRSLGFPGSHPVSLDLNNVELLKQRRYYATWKADGIRFMMLITNDGCFLIDRKFDFRRVQMRFPGGSEDNGTHHMTLLDGEMVIDTIPETGKKEKRFLVYDMMALNGKSTVNLPFYERWNMVETEVIGPRNLEKMNIDQSRKPWYRYELEPFRMRRKGFYALFHVPNLLDKFIPNLCHKADGLIFQGWDEPYEPRADPRLLKWKPQCMNSVDFLFSVDRYNRHQLYLYDRGQKRLLEGANRVLFEDGSDPRSYSGKIIECAWRKEANAWVFMRIRDDKDGPNAYHTYRNVMKSIDDDITKEMLLDKIKNTIRLPLYNNS